MDTNTLQENMNNLILNLSSDADIQQVGKVIKTLRSYHCIRLKNVAKHLNISYQQVSNYEKQNAKINIKNLVKIFDTLGYKLTLTATKKD